MYPAELTEPMRAELTDIGVTELRDAAAVDSAVADNETVLIFVNSVCGCAAGGARPGLAYALQQTDKRPAAVTTVFAGVDPEAVAQARKHFAGYPPSSPSAALLKDGEVVWMLHRHQIEGQPPQLIGDALKEAFQTHC